MDGILVGRFMPNTPNIERAIGEIIIHYVANLAQGTLSTAEGTQYACFEALKTVRLKLDRSNLLNKLDKDFMSVRGLKYQVPR